VKNSIRWSATRVLCAVIWERRVVYLEVITIGGGMLLLAEAINFFTIFDLENSSKLVKTNSQFYFWEKSSDVFL